MADLTIREKQWTCNRTRGRHKHTHTHKVPLRVVDVWSSGKMIRTGLD